MLGWRPDGGAGREASNSKARSHQRNFLDWTLTIVYKKTYFMVEKVEKYCACDRTWRRFDVRSSRQGGCGRGWRRGWVRTGSQGGVGGTAATRVTRSRCSWSDNKAQKVRTHGFFTLVQFKIGLITCKWKYQYEKLFLLPPDRCGNRGLAVAAASRPSLEATSNLFSSVREPSTSTSSSSSSFSCLTEADKHRSSN